MTKYFLVLALVGLWLVPAWAEQEQKANISVLESEPATQDPLFNDVTLTDDQLDLGETSDEDAPILPVLEDLQRPDPLAGFKPTPEDRGNLAIRVNNDVLRFPVGELKRCEIYCNSADWCQVTFHFYPHQIMSFNEFVQNKDYSTFQLHLDGHPVNQPIGRVEQFELAELLLLPMKGETVDVIRSEVPQLCRF